MMKKILLISLMAIFLFSCSANPDSNSKNNADPTTESQADIADDNENASENIENEETEITALDIIADLPDADYGGYTFTILTSNGAQGGEFEMRQAPEETENGEPINDALFRRGRLIEDKYNINLNYIIENDIANMLSMSQKTIKSGDNAYDMIIGELLGVTRALAQSGGVHDFADFPNIDLSKPWWNKNAIRDLTIDGKFFFPIGDITPRYILSPYFLMFNKTLFADYGLDFPYDKVLDGTWTIDEFYNLVKGQTRDLNSDGRLDGEDFYGMFNAGFSAYAMMKSCGESIISTKDGNPYISIGNERSIDIIEKITGLLVTNDIYYDTKYKPFDEYYIFSNGQALFVGQTAAILAMYRDMEYDYGILPLPKYDLNQESYYSYAQPWDSVGLSVPKTNEDTERSGMIIEALAAVGKYTSTPAQYEITLKTKFIRDEYSPKMLDIICETATYDLGHIYNFGGCFDVLNNSFHRNQPFTSQLEKIMPKMQAEIDKTIKTFSES